MTLRTAFSGGSGVGETSSSPPATSPGGRQLRASTITQSTTNRANSSTRKTSSTDDTICQKRATFLARPGHLSCRGHRRAHHGAGDSGLVEETALADPRLVLSRHVDVLRTQQEHLCRDALDATSQPEGETRGEVDQSLGVRVVHLGQVHDDRQTFAEALPDGPRLVVGAWVQGRDAVRLRRGCRRGSRGRLRRGRGLLTDGQACGARADGTAAHSGDAWRWTTAGRRHPDGTGGHDPAHGQRLGIAHGRELLGPEVVVVTPGGVLTLVASVVPVVRGKPLVIGVTAVAAGLPGGGLPGGGPAVAPGGGRPRGAPGDGH